MQKSVEPLNVSFSIFGICVSRDIVNVLGSHVNRFIQDISPISVCYNSPLADGLRLDEENIVEYLLNPKLNHFHVRNTILDMNKDVYRYLFEVNSDWLILDTGCLRYRTLVNKEYNTAVTECHLHRLNYSYDKNSCHLVSTMDLSQKDFEQYMDQYLLRILENIDEDKIIVVETYLVRDYVDSSRKSIKSFNNKYKERNAEIRRGYEYLKCKLKKAHFIPFLKNNLGDESNKWGKASLHYVKEYYEYGSEVIKIIMAQLPMEEERIHIERLKDYYQQRLGIEYLYLGAL